MIQPRVLRDGKELSLEQTLMWLDSSGISFPRGPITEMVLGNMIKSRNEYSYDRYFGGPELMKDLEEWSQKALLKDKEKINRFLNRIARRIPSRLMPLEVQNFLGNYNLYLSTERYTRAIEQLQKLSAWVQKHEDWIDVAEDIGKLEDKAPGAIELHGKTQAGMTIKSIWKNIWDGGGLNLQSDLDRYSDWIQRIKQALLRLENPNVDTGYRDPHLDRFSAQPVSSSDSPKYVYALAKINNTTVHGQTDLSIKSEMERPDTSLEVTSTTGDGEVNPLTETLQAFLEHLKVSKNRTSKRTFELSLSGSAGACDGCKKRIAKFVELWADAAESAMKTGVEATLRVTYRYLNKAYVARDKLVYGWYEDNKIGGYYYHTVDRKVIGRG